MNTGAARAFCGMQVRRGDVTRDVGTNFVGTLLTAQQRSYDLGTS